jgi:hypothetical protein
MSSDSWFAYLEVHEAVPLLLLRRRQRRRRHGRRRAANVRRFLSWQALQDETLATTHSGVEVKART